MNENYAQPSLPVGLEQDIVKGMYRFGGHDVLNAKGRVRLLGSGAILREAIAAAELLANDWQIASDIFSVTSFSELAREAREMERWNRLHPEQAMRRSHLESCLDGAAPIIAASDYVRAYPQLIASYVDARFVALGTDGFGRSDTRTALRRFFEVDRHHIALAAIDALVREEVADRALLGEAIKRYRIDAECQAPWNC